MKDNIASNTNDVEQKIIVETFAESLMAISNLLTKKLNIKRNVFVENVQKEKRNTLIESTDMHVKMISFATDAVVKLINLKSANSLQRKRITNFNKAFISPIKPGYSAEKRKININKPTEDTAETENKKFDTLDKDSHLHENKNAEFELAKRIKTEHNIDTNQLILNQKDETIEEKEKKMSENDLKSEENIKEKQNHSTNENENNTSDDNNENNDTTKRKSNKNLSEQQEQEMNESENGDKSKKTCPECRKEFCNIGTLNRHITSIHSTVIHKCPNCSWQNCRIDKLNEHVRKKHI